MVDRGASDLHLSANSPPRIRIDGILRPLDDASLNPGDVERLCFELSTEKQRQRFQELGEIDFSFGISGLARFRANVFREKDSIAGAFRALPWKIPAPKDLGLPQNVLDLAHKRQGLVLVTGATGSGKSTTIASLINLINQSREEHVITIEDPIEYVFEHNKCMIHQRETGTHTKDFQSALKYILRQDPDVVLIGEMRDLETIRAAITIAETGHLVFATLHTNTAVQTIDRIIDVFPPSQQAQIRSQLSFILEAVLSQQLLPLRNGGRKLALELLFPNYAIRNLIREGKAHQIYAQMQSGQEQSRMKTMNQSLIEMLAKNEIELDVARKYSPAIQEFDQLWEKTKATPPVSSAAG